MYIGLYFGSFNPVHNGHISIAEYMYQHYHFDEIWFVVSPANPLKRDETLLNEFKRIELVKVATENKSYFIPSDIEFHLPKPSYTYITLQELRIKYAAYHFALILGSDNIDKIMLWKNYEEILQNYLVYVYPRSKELHRIIHEHIIYTQPNLLNISSTLIREKIKKGENIADFIHPRVLKIIEQEKLYK